MARLAVIGIGPGGRDYITPAALRAVAEAEVLVGGERQLALFNLHRGETFIIRNNLNEMVEFIKARIKGKKVAVLASGDPGMFGILSYLKRHFESGELFVVPGISTVQYACAVLAIPWHDAVAVSTHGRDRQEFIEAARREGKVVVLAGPAEPPPELARALVEAGVGDKTVFVCSDLSYPNEEVKSFTLTGLAALEGFGEGKNYVMVIVNER